MCYSLFVRLDCVTFDESLSFGLVGCVAWLERFPKVLKRYSVGWCRLCCCVLQEVQDLWVAVIFLPAIIE